MDRPTLEDVLKLEKELTDLVDSRPASGTDEEKSAWWTSVQEKQQEHRRVSEKYNGDSLDLE